jgi:hypothetical protein
MKTFVLGGSGSESFILELSNIFTRRRGTIREQNDANYFFSGEIVMLPIDGLGSLQNNSIKPLQNPP